MIGKRYLRNDAELKDVLQDSFVHIFKNLVQFDVQKSSFKTWATQITINNCLKYNARNHRTGTVELIVNLHDKSIEPNAIKTLTNDELVAWLKKMPFQYFEVFNLYIIDGYSHDEIAKMLGISSVLSRKRLSRAKEWLKKREGVNNQFSARFLKN